MYQQKPSDVLFIEDKYIAFCFNEACMYIINKLEEVDKDNKKVNKPKWLEDKKVINKNNNDDVIEWMKTLS